MLRIIFRYILGIATLLFLMPASLHSQPVVPYGNNPAAGKYIMLNGVRHYYEVYGSGRPVLLIHGNHTATAGFAQQLEYFSKAYQVFSVDCRGRGKSDLGNDSLTFKQIAADMNAFIAAQKLDNVYIIGKSDGAIVAIMMGIYYPDHISKIVAFAANLQADTNALYPHTIAEIKRDREKAEQRIKAKDTTQNWLAEKLRLRLDEFQPNVTAQELSRIKVPVLVMSADRDIIKPEHTLWIYQHIPLAHLCILPAEKHSLPKDNATLFNQIVDEFLSRPFMPSAARFE